MRKILLVAPLFFSMALFAKETKYFFAGKINNKYNIHLFICVEDNNDVTGNYYYLSASKYIHLQGRKSGDVISLNETDDNNTITAVFIGQLINNTYAGTWTKSDGKNMPFNLSKKDLTAPTADSISGTYEIGMSGDEKIDAEIPKGESGFGGYFSCLLLPNGKIDFFLSYSKGYPGYHIGEINGIAELKQGSVYEYKQLVFGDADKPCHILFTFKNKEVEIEQKSDDISCGFGAFVDAGGTYKKESNKIDIGSCGY